MSHPGFLRVIEDLERQLAGPMPAPFRRLKQRHLKRELDRARRAGYQAQAILDAQRRGRSLK
jgi:hypothetical protein